MNKWTVRQRILASFAIVLTLMLIMGTVASVALHIIDRKTDALLSDSLPGVRHSTQVLTGVLDLHQLTLHHVVSADPREMQGLESDIRQLIAQQDESLKEYESTIHSTTDRQLFEAVKTARELYFRYHGQLMKLSTNLQNKEAAKLYREQLGPQFEKLRSSVIALKDHNEAQNTSAIESIEGLVVNSRTVVVLCLLAALIVAFFAGRSLLHAINRPLTRLVEVLNIMRQGDFTERMKLDRSDEFGQVADGFNRMTDELAALVGQVQKSGLQVTTSVTEVSATAKQQQATAKEVAATTAEIGATSREIAATSKELVKTVNEVASVAERSAVLAGSGQTSLSHMEATMQRVMDATGTINAKLAVLNEKASNINQVITTITKVADQTNLLSLNAAIEAEKAGEHGRGFAVVATEIRRLADQTGVATYDIEQTVKEIQSALSASVMGMDKFSEEVRRGMQEVQQIGGQLSEIIQHVQALAPRIESVNEGMQAQATGAEQITQALAQLNDSIQQTVESLQQSNIAIDQLNQVANGLRNGVSRFKLLPA